MKHKVQVLVLVVRALCRMILELDERVTELENKNI